MDPAMRRAASVAVVGLFLLATFLALTANGASAAPAATGTSGPLTGNITGPTVLGYSANETYIIHAAGGPAFNTSGTQIGNFTYYASVTGSNTTGVSVLPSESGITNLSGTKIHLTVTTVTQLLTVVVEVTSVYKTENVSLNLTYSVNVVQPYTLTLNLISDSSATIVGFPLTVDLDGTPVGTINIPSLTAGESYVATFEYPTVGLASGEHTFTVSLANEHGLVTFAGGATSYSTTFYIPGPPPSYTVWYVAGAVAFFGAIFILVTRVAARRRNPTRK